MTVMAILLKQMPWDEPMSTDEIFPQLPLVEGLDLHAGTWDYYDGPCSGEVQMGEDTLTFWWWGEDPDGRRTYVLVRADLATRAAMRRAESWEQVVELAGDCEVVGRTVW